MTAIKLIENVVDKFEENLTECMTMVHDAGLSDRDTTHTCFDLLTVFGSIIEESKDIVLGSERVEP